MNRRGQRIPCRTNCLFSRPSPLFILIITSCILAANSCSMPGFAINEIELVQLVDIVMYGKVLGRMNEHQYAEMGWTRAYDARVEVYCTLKGDSLPRFVNISEAGFIMGQCSNKILNVGEEYLLLLHTNGGKLTPSDEVPRQGSPDNMRRVLSACGLARQPILGSTSIHPKCPLVASSQDCVRPPTTEPGLNICEHDGEYYEDGEEWLYTSSSPQCLHKCQCIDTETVCTLTCPPLGELPDPSPACPEPHYIPTVCCSKLHCYKEDEPEPPTKAPPTLPTKPTTSTPVKPSTKHDDKGDIMGKDEKNDSSKKGGKTGEIKGESSSVLLAPSYLLVLTIDLIFVCLF